MTRIFRGTDSHKIVTAEFLVLALNFKRLSFPFLFPTLISSSTINMATYTVSSFSPSKNTTSTSLRSIQPSPEKDALKSIAVFKRSSSIMAELTGSPVVKRHKRENPITLDHGMDQTRIYLDLTNRWADIQLDFQPQANEPALSQLHNLVRMSKHVQLSKTFVLNGRALLPNPDELRELSKLFPSTFAVEVEPPFIIFRVHNLPPKPWPLTVAGLPIWFTTEESGGTFDKGLLGRGPKLFNDMSFIDDDCSMDFLAEVISAFQQRKIPVSEILWCFGYFRIVISDKLNLKSLPFLIAKCPAFYRESSDVETPDASAMRNKVPDGTIIDDSTYLTATSVLRPGILLGSSNIQGEWLSTTSGILVADSNNEIYITIASHGFRPDCLVYHPSPTSGTIIARIDRHIPGLDVSLAKLNQGLTYVNETFDDSNGPGVMLSGIATSPKGYEPLTMNNPYTGSCEGLLLGVGIRVEGEEAVYVKHHWAYMESGLEPERGCCGTPVLNGDDEVIGLFRYKYSDNMCYAVSALQLREVGLEVVGGKYTF